MAKPVGLHARRFRDGFGHSLMERQRVACGPGSIERGCRQRSSRRGQRPAILLVVPDGRCAKTLEIGLRGRQPADGVFRLLAQQRDPRQAPNVWATLITSSIAIDI